MLTKCWDKISTAYILNDWTILNNNNFINNEMPWKSVFLFRIFTNNNFSLTQVGLLTMEGIFCVSGDAYMNWKVSRMNRGLIHLFLNLIGLLLVLIGMVIIIIGKIEYKKSHFVTLHGIISLISIIFAILIAASGFVVVFDKCLYHGCIRPIILKIMHSFGGILAAILLLAGLITGIYTGWWPGTCLGRSLTVASFVIAACYIFLKPILGIISRCRVLFEGVPNDNERELNNEYWLWFWKWLFYCLMLLFDIMMD